jgi:hypothetical protein
MSIHQTSFTRAMCLGNFNAITLPYGMVGAA